MTDKTGTHQDTTTPSWRHFHSRVQDFADSVVSSVNFDMHRLDPAHTPEPDIPCFGPAVSADPEALAQNGGQHHPRYTGHWRRTAEAGFTISEVMASNRLISVPDAVSPCAN